MKNFKVSSLQNSVKENFMRYAMKVIVDRAIPDVRDGLKPVQRRILYSLYSMGMLNKQAVKCNLIQGEVMKIHEHGDSSIISALARMTTENESLLHPFIEGEGNYGKVYSSDAHSAARYLEAKLDVFSKEMFSDFEKKSVTMIPDYNEIGEEPLVLPNTFPNVLTMPNSGIAVSLASKICSFNLSELCEATIRYIEDKSIDLIQFMLPDFSTGGELIYNEDSLRKIYETGRGSLKLRAKYTYDNEHNCIDIYEIPYDTNASMIRNRIVNLIENNKVKEILDVRDESGFDVKQDKTVLRITIDLKKGTDPDILMQKLYKLTPLSYTFSCNFNVLVDYKPRVLGVKAILDEWVKFRIQCIKRATQFDIDKNSNKLHLLKGLERVLLDLERAINIVKNTEDDSQVIPSLMSSFNIDEKQAEYVAEIKLRNFNKQYILSRTKEIESLMSEIQHLKNIYNNESEIKQIIISQLQDVIKKYGKSRRTEIIYDDFVEDTKEVIIDDYNCKLILTSHSYLKKNLRYSDSQKLKDGDSIIQVVDSNNKDDIILLSNLGNCYKLKCHELNEHRPSQLGEYLPNVLNMEKNEQIIFVESTSTYSGYIVSVFENGKVAKVNLNSFQTKTNRSKLANSLNVDSPVTRILHIEKDTDLILVSDINKVLAYNTSNINAKSSRNTQGNQVMKSKSDSKVLSVKLLNEVEFEDVSYYASNNAAVGKYLKKNDKILF